MKRLFIHTHRMKNLTILTGASRGMGLALAQQLCDQANAQLLCISRQSAPALDSWAASKGASLVQWRADLAQPTPVAQKLLAWLQQLDPAQFASITLINNAGVIGHLGPMTPQSDGLLQQTLAINLQAPMQLTAAFLTATRAWHASKKVVNISSGLGRRAMAGSSMYCASKARLGSLQPLCGPGRGQLDQRRTHCFFGTRGDRYRYAIRFACWGPQPSFPTERILSTSKPRVRWPLQMRLLLEYWPT